MLDDKILKDEVFHFLDNLRESGITNMFGAGRYISVEFGLDTNDAGKYLQEWMATFSGRHPQDNVR